MKQSYRKVFRQVSHEPNNLHASEVPSDFKDLVYWTKTALEQNWKGKLINARPSPQQLGLEVLSMNVPMEPIQQ